jgi:hypothetical protein
VDQLEQLIVANWSDNGERGRCFGFAAFTTV